MRQIEKNGRSSKITNIHENYMHYKYPLFWTSDCPTHLWVGICNDSLLQRLQVFCRKDNFQFDFFTNTHSTHLQYNQLWERATSSPGNQFWLILQKCCAWISVFSADVDAVWENWCNRFWDFYIDLSSVFWASVVKHKLQLSNLPM